MDARRDSMDEDTSPLPLDVPVSPIEGMSTEVVLDDEPLSAVSSSRSTTMSPRPQSGDTAHSSPAGDMQEFKHRGSDEETQRAIRESRKHRLSGKRLGHRPSSSAATNDRSKEMDIDSEAWEEELMTPSMGSDYPNRRIIPTSPSSFLRPGSKFHGTQQSERQVYDVQVEIKHVDLRESFLCGYLRIQGLTEDHPTLTTYFEGEIIGTKYGFNTNHETWGATDKIDLNHWAKFTAFRPFQKQARKGPVVIPDVAQRENIFMRWKEHFLVPDHRVRTISGASFEGFYYICFNQIKGEVSGIYFHSKSEKFQQLELKHVEDRGCFGAMEFR
ncbi:Glucose-induced degradation protein 4-like protein [Colletotrichum trifolii]|uniref:Glucose-induced degradation protein 4-like protein n=1 Tax=Colletotrichum trifolii TaxID=5466 RepID=A0A4R8RPD4_COLTR|nr:Glucose-induced degradation protein 4-like protein [Colletotrichum trifolii]